MTEHPGNDLDAITEDIAMAQRSAEMSRHVALDHGPELIAEIRQLRDRAIRLGTWLEEVLHVHFYDMSEWETVERWLTDPGSFDIFGEPFKSSLPILGEENSMAESEYEDPYVNKIKLGNMVRDAAGLRVNDADALNRVSSIMAAEKFVNALVGAGSMITRLPTGPDQEATPEPEGPLQVWGIYKNTDMTEGRGREYLDRVFATEEAASRWRATQSDYPGWPFHKIVPVTLDLAGLESFEGMKMP